MEPYFIQDFTVAPVIKKKNKVPTHVFKSVRIFFAYVYFLTSIFFVRQFTAAIRRDSSRLINPFSLSHLNANDAFCYCFRVSSQGGWFVKQRCLYTEPRKKRRKFTGIIPWIRLISDLEGTSSFSQILHKGLMCLKANSYCLYKYAFVKEKNS